MVNQMRVMLEAKSLTSPVEKCLYRGRDSNSYDLCDRGILRFPADQREMKVRIRPVSGKSTISVALAYFSNTILRVMIFPSAANTAK